ncbi:MAG: hypothetical protein LC790_12245 [Actinobacteria bacterium]|nr:hypothetical protein [Actinomycetota bacterium]MCA1699616.1 hypothetical protein [Actinomycetota bacterium]
MIAASRAGGRAVPALVGELAVCLSGLFERDVAIVERLNDAQRRLRHANERLWSGLSPGGFGLVYDGAAPAGQSQIAGLVLSADGGSESQVAVLGALQQTHWLICRAFHDYQGACEKRRALAVEVGELSQQLIEALCAADWSADDARDANVHELAGAVR